MKKFSFFTIVFMMIIHVACSQNVVGNSSYRDPTGIPPTNDIVAIREHFSSAANARNEYNRRNLTDVSYQKTGPSNYLEFYKLAVPILVLVSSSGRMTNHGILTHRGIISILIENGNVTAVGIPAWLSEYH